MNLIEQFGYEAVQAEIKDKKWRRNNLHGSAEFTWHIEQHIQLLEAILLQHRRQHNIFEIDDYVVYQGGAGLSGLFRIEKLTKTGKPKSVKSNRFGGFPCRYCEIRHATPEEIKAGRRL